MNYEIFNHNHTAMGDISLLSLVLIGSGILGVRGLQCDLAGSLQCDLAGSLQCDLAGSLQCDLAGSLQCDLAGSLQCVATYSSVSKFKFSSNTEDFQGNVTDLVSDTCLKLEDLYECVGDKLLGCEPQYRLIYETTLSSGRFMCGSGKQGFIDNFRCLVSHNLQNHSISCGGKILTVIRDIFSNPATILPDLASRADKLCIRANDTLRCVVKSTSTGCGTSAVTFIQQYMESFISPLKSFFSCVDEMEEPYSYKTTTDNAPHVADSKYLNNGHHDSAASTDTRTNNPPLVESDPTPGRGISKPEPMEDFGQAGKTSEKEDQDSAHHLQNTAKLRKVRHREVVSRVQSKADFPVNLDSKLDKRTNGKSSSMPGVIQSHLDIFPTPAKTPEPQQHQENLSITESALPETVEPERTISNQPHDPMTEVNVEPKPEPEQPNPVPEPHEEPTGTPEPALPEPVQQKPTSDTIVQHSSRIVSTPQPRPEETVTPEPDEPLPEAEEYSPTTRQNTGTTPDPRTTQSANQRSSNLPPKEHSTAIPHTTLIKTTPLPNIRSLDNKHTHRWNNRQTTVNESGPKVIRVRVPIRLQTQSLSSTTTTIAPVVIAKISRTCKKYCFRFRNSSSFTKRQKQQYDLLCDSTCRAGKCPSRVCSRSCGCPRTLMCRYTGPRRRWAGDHWCNNLCRSGSPLCRRTHCDCHYA